MNCQNINNLIHDYFNNELSTEQESFLFTHLAQCKECKTNFKAMNRVHYEFRKEESDIPEQLEQRIFNTIKNRESHAHTISSTKRLPAYFVYGYGILLTLFSVFMTYEFYDLRNETMKYKESFEITIGQLNSQQKQMSSLLKIIPAVKVRASVGNSDLLKRGI